MLRSAVIATAGFTAFLAAAAAHAESVNDLIRKLGDADTADATVTALVQQGPAAVKPLTTTARGAADVAVRGWAIVAMGRIPGAEADAALLALQQDNAAPVLVQTWAAAARIARAGSPEELMELAKLKGRYPALDRPLKMQFTAMFTSGAHKMTAEAMLRASTQMPEMQSALMGPIMALGPAGLVTALAHGADDNVRRQAAAYLATMAQKGQTPEVAKQTVAVYRFDPSAIDVPWAGGALFVPGITWPKAEGTLLVGNLVAWMVFADRTGKSAYIQQIHNNIRSLSLAQAVGYASPGWNDVDTITWLRIWGKLVGRAELQRLLERQGVATSSRYASVLGELR
jgi:hypothetical protein